MARGLDAHVVDSTGKVDSTGRVETQSTTLSPQSCTAAPQLHRGTAIALWHRSCTVAPTQPVSQPSGCAVLRGTR
eukprot:358494-Chlamydomonas_euryale.AAC.3